MKKTVITALGFFAIPFVAVLLNACGPVNGASNDELALDTLSDNYLVINGQYSEYGRCNDTWDNDGDGLNDMHDPDCHFVGPLRDLSLHDFPVGHNFYPDETKIPKGGPGEPGGFRDPVQMTKWFRFLTEPHGYVAGIDLYTPGVNPGVVPYPAPLAEPPFQGTYSQGNNYNLSIRNLHNLFLDHDGLLPPYAAETVLEPTDVGSNVEIAPGDFDTGARFNMPFYRDPRSRWGGWPGYFYGAQGPNRWGVTHGSQGALQPAKTGNPDNKDGNTRD